MSNSVTKTQPGKPVASTPRNTADQAKQQTVPAHAGAQPAYQYSFSRMPLAGEGPGIVQARLSVQTSGDHLEKEADHAATQAMQPQVAQPAKLQAGSAARATAAVTAPPIVQNALQTQGEPLDAATRNKMEAKLGHDFSKVRVHADAQAAAAASSINAEAYTAGNHVVFGQGRYAPASGNGGRLLAHELAHVVQQGGGGGQVQRYEAGEHSQLGDAGDEFKKMATPAVITYIVKKGEVPEQIAKKFGVTVAELKEANKDKWHIWNKNSEGFKQGDQLVIPTKIAPAIKDALNDGGKFKVNVNGVDVDYGDIIAMSGDMFESPDDLLKMSKAEIEEIVKLIKEEKTTGKAVSSERWDKATKGKFTELAQKNEKHFAPSNAAFVPVSSAAHGGDHKTEWEKFHAKALGLAKDGKKNEALLQNAFGDHYLTDAFAAGHLFNKRDLMEHFNSQLPTSGTGDKRDFTAASKTFFDDVAHKAWGGDLAKAFSELETTDFKGVIFRPNIDSESRFSSLLQGIHLKEPDVLESAVVKTLHDDLNTMPGGLDVENNMGDAWPLSGDNTLNAKTTAIAHKAVAQSQLNIISTLNAATAPDIPAMQKKVWDYTPHPTTASTATIKSKVAKDADPKSASLTDSLAALLVREHKLIIKKLIERGILKKA
ncbi:eCIS core domain-containing protein [Deminuibacter soli]|uniref:DUF4157 domain-containing protein n=1 Tax=Deminuibacter soli TaxID=2291815 RepID=A0A3E1NGE5_9BACT|nr:DUF4157 domain-containing protein [Deminuibacter soli]RFM26952.1 DUF4157 domain-containing protein [Deminuibacter soli]